MLSPIVGENSGREELKMDPLNEPEGTTPEDPTAPNVESSDKEPGSNQKGLPTTPDEAAVRGQ